MPPPHETTQSPRSASEGAGHRSPAAPAAGESPPGSSGRRLAGTGSPRPLQAVLLVAALLVAILAATAEQERRAERHAILDLLRTEMERAGRTADAVTAGDERSLSWDEPTQLRLELARELVNDVLEPPESGATAEVAPAAATLPLARRLAGRAFADRPAAWRGPALLGAALYLERSLAGDRRLVTEGSLWEAPLSRSRELAPTAVGASRFLATAYLELWPYLPGERRAAARQLLADAFRRPDTLGRLLEPWLQVAQDAEEAFSVVPDQPRAWEQVQQALARSGNTAAYLEARRRWRDAVEAELTRDLDEAARLARGGELFEARREYLERIASTPFERRFAEEVERALDEAPAGAALPNLAPRLRPWLDGALALDLVGRPVLSPGALDRLASQVAELPAATAAHAAVAAGRLADAERQERRAARDTAIDVDAWGGYRVAQARALTARDQAAEALSVLDRLPPSGRERPSALAARRDAAVRAGLPEEAAAAEAALLRQAGGEPEWLPAGRPRPQARALRAEIATPAGAVGVRVRGTAAAPTLVELHLDGELVATRRIRAGTGSLEGSFPVAPREGGSSAEAASTPRNTGPPEVHLVEVVPVDGRTFRPVTVEILPGPR